MAGETDSGIDLGREALLRALREGGVRFVLIGAALESHQQPHRTEDIDVTPDRERENLERLAETAQGSCQKDLTGRAGSRSVGMCSSPVHRPVASPRLTQVAASEFADGTLAHARSANSGQVLSVSADLARAGWWVVVTREHTSGGGEYAGLAPCFTRERSQVRNPPRPWLDLLYLSHFWRLLAKPARSVWAAKSAMGLFIGLNPSRCGTGGDLGFYGT
jgi:hypothetical protein